MSVLDRQISDDEAGCEFVAIAALAAAEAGAPAGWALGLGVRLATARYPGLAAASAQWRRLRLAPDKSLPPPEPGLTPASQELLGLISAAQDNGDDVCERLRIYLANSFERREFTLRKRIETVPVYMVVVLVLFFMPAILLLLVGPSFLALLRALYEV